MGKVMLMVSKGLKNLHVNVKCLVLKMNELLTFCCVLCDINLDMSKYMFM